MRDYSLACVSQSRSQSIRRQQACLAHLACEAQWARTAAGGSLLLSHPSTLTLKMTSLSLPLSPYCFIISVLPSTKIDEMLSCVSD